MKHFQYGVGNIAGSRIEEIMERAADIELHEMTVRETVTDADPKRRMPLIRRRQGWDLIWRGWDAEPSAADQQSMERLLFRGFPLGMEVCEILEIVRGGVQNQDLALFRKGAYSVP